MIDTQNIEIDFEASETEAIMQNVKIILTTLTGTVPFYRDFGIRADILDLSLEQAKHLLTVEYIEKIRKFEPRARVKQVAFEHNATNGILRPKVVLDLVN